jgi:hypothetical protein
VTDLSTPEVALDVTESGHTVIYKSYLSSIEEAVEHIRAADTLGLGFQLESYDVSSAEEPGAPRGEFEFTLLGEMPARLETED